MVKYSREPENATKAAKSRGSYLRVHYKHCREVMHAIKGKQLTKAIAYLEDVLQFKAAIPFTVFTGGCGRHAMGKQLKASGSKVKWPQKASRMILGLLKNAQANAEVKGLDVEGMYVSHAQANQAPQQRRRTYRAHGRIGPYMSSPAHLELVVSERHVPVAKAEEVQPKISRKRAAQLRLKEGGGVEDN